MERPRFRRAGLPPLSAPHPYISLNPKTSIWAKRLPALETHPSTSLLAGLLLTGTASPRRPSQTHRPPGPQLGWEARRSQAPPHRPPPPLTQWGSTWRRRTLLSEPGKRRAAATEEQGEQGPGVKGEVAWVPQGQRRA